MQKYFRLRQLKENCVIIKFRFAHNAITNSPAWGFADGMIDKRVR